MIVAPATVRNGKLFIRERGHFDEQVRQMKEGWQLEVTVRRLRATRSQQANRYYWGVVLTTLVRHCDFQYTPEEMHEVLKAKFLPKTLAIHDGNGEIVFEYVIGGSTRSMNTTQFSDYVRDIKQWALDTLGCYATEPDEVEF
jgi:hypothetical protein